MTRVGSPVDHRGVRYPFAANLKEAERQATQGSSTIAEWRKGNYRSYRPYSELLELDTALPQGLVA